MGKIDLDARLRHPADSYAIGRLRCAGCSPHCYTHPTHAGTTDRHVDPAHTSSSNPNTKSYTKGYGADAQSGLYG